MYVCVCVEEKYEGHAGFCAFQLCFNGAPVLPGNGKVEMEIFPVSFFYR